MQSTEFMPMGGGPSIVETVHGCLRAQEDRGLLERTIRHLRSYLVEFAETCATNGVTAPAELTPGLVSEYVQDRCRGRGPAVLKACVWAMRTLGGYLMLKGLVTAHPAAALRMPRIPARAQLPQYLTPEQLRQLLDTAARERLSRDVVLLALISSTGLRPHEVVGLERTDIHRQEHWLDVLVKGGWRKATPLSPAMARMLGDYLESREDDARAAFVGVRGRPISVSWLQRMVAKAGEQADLPMRLTCRLLRHTFATHAADRNGKVVTKALLGHRRMRTTEVYTHLSARRFQPLMNRHPYATQISPETDRA